MDAFYERLIDTHNGLSHAESEMVNAKLVLLLANHIGDIDVLAQAFAVARRGAIGAAPGRAYATGPVVKQ
jgi:hypothetical protein